MILIPLSDLSVFSCAWVLLHGRCFPWCSENWRWRGGGSFLCKLNFILAKLWDLTQETALSSMFTFFQAGQFSWSSLHIFLHVACEVFTLLLGLIASLAFCKAALPAWAAVFVWPFASFQRSPQRRRGEVSVHSVLTTTQLWFASVA